MEGWISILSAFGYSTAKGLKRCESTGRESATAWSPPHAFEYLKGLATQFYRVISYISPGVGGLARPVL
jgi:hypothetical protein